MISTSNTVQAAETTENMRIAFQIFSTLSQAGQDSAVDYLNYLASKEAEARAARFQDGAKAIRNIIGNEIPWPSEEAMIEEITDERRKRRAARRAERERFQK